MTAEKGYEDILNILDDKSKELQQEALRKGLREYFYQVMIKPGEAYRNFMVRLDTSYRKLVQHGIELPDEVQGWFLMRKLGLDQASESMLLTATNGSLKKTEVIKAVKAIFPQGKRGAVKKSDVFVSEDQLNEPETAEADYSEDAGDSTIPRRSSRSSPSRFRRRATTMTRKPWTCSRRTEVSRRRFKKRKSEEGSQRAVASTEDGTQ